MQPVVFRNITRQKFSAVCAKIESQGTVSMVGDAGTASGHGFKASWIYSEPDQTLTIQCLEKPMLVPESLVTAKIQALVESVG